MSDQKSPVDDAAQPQKTDRTAKQNQPCAETNEKEIGGYENMKEPTTYGDWQTNGRCSDF